MGVFAGPDVSESGLVLALDVANKKSYSQNEFQYSTDIFAWCGSAGHNAATITRDTISSPVGNTPLKMAVTGSDPHIATYNSSTWNIAPAANGQTWVVSVYVKADVATTGQIFIFGANSSGTGFVGSAWLTIAATTFNITTEWTRVSYYATMSDASIAYIHTRLDGPDTGGTGQTIWWDGLQVERVPSGTTTPTSFTSSYYGGSVFRDLSGNENTATMFGSVPFSTDVAPCFDFATATGADATNSSLGFTFGSNMIPTTGDFTFSCWIKNPNASTGQVGLFSNAGGGDGYRFGLNRSSVYFLIGPTYTEGNISFSSTLSSSLWYNVVAVFSRTTAQVLVYLNGVYQSAASIPVSQTAFNGAAVPGLVKSACCTIYTGKLAVFSAYRKALSAAEIQQNFNATRGRYGI